MTEAVGEDEFEDIESWGDDEPNIDVSVTDKSLFNSSLLLPVTDKDITINIIP